MKKVILIGAGGAGKSTLARGLAAKTGIPLVHLDSLFWRPGWVETPAAEWRAAVLRETSGESWIMDGNFGGTLEARLAACDTVVLLDLPPWLCLGRVICRRFQFHGRSRPDITPGCNERIDMTFLWWILTYRARRIPRLLAKLESAKQQGKQVFVLRSREAVGEFLEHAA